MPTPLAKGIIIAASVLVAAGIAAYENPQVREWLDKSSQKFAMAIRSLGDEIQGKPPASRRQDPSMNEDQDEKAEERRRQARAEIMERGRVMEERKKRRRLSQERERTPSFDTLVDENGMLKEDVEGSKPSGIQMNDNNGTLRNRNISNSTQADLTQINMQPATGPSAIALEPWESQYEREMRNTWSITLPPQQQTNLSSHASESLIDLTPTTEDFPDPDFSIPSADNLHSTTERSQYFSVASINNSRTFSNPDSEPDFYYAHPSRPDEPLNVRSTSQQANPSLLVGSSAASLAGSNPRVFTSESETDDDFSELSDGVRTPASAWTELGSSVSGDM